MRHRCRTRSVPQAFPVIPAAGTIRAGEDAALERPASSTIDSERSEGVHVVNGHPAGTLVRIPADVASDVAVVRPLAGLMFDPPELGPVCTHLVRVCPATLLVLPRVARHALSRRHGATSTPLRSRRGNCIL